jgi:hypothetical protein
MDSWFGKCSGDTMPAADGQHVSVAKCFGGVALGDVNQAQHLRSAGSPLLAANWCRGQPVLIGFPVPVIWRKALVSLSRFGLQTVEVSRYTSAG